MPAIVVIGAHWGDEGKGKIVDMLSQSADMVARFSGGDNAGHTVINHLGEFSLHQIPTGIFCPNTTCVIGNGAVVNAETVLRELALVEGLGIEVARRYIDRADLVLFCVESPADLGSAEREFLAGLADVPTVLLRTKADLVSGERASDDLDGGEYGCSLCHQRSCVVICGMMAVIVQGNGVECFKSIRPACS